MKRDDFVTTIRCQEPECDWTAQSHFQEALEADYLEHTRDEHVWWPRDDPDLDEAGETG